VTNEKFKSKTKNKGERHRTTSPMITEPFELQPPPCRVQVYITLYEGSLLDPLPFAAILGYQQEILPLSKKAKHNMSY